MNKMLVAVFDTETKAYEGLSALRELHTEGTLSVFATGVIVKDEEGKVEIKQATDRGGKSAFTGLAVGSLIGFLAGPVGLAIGASTGTMIGLIADLRNTGISVDFVDEVSNALTNGKSAVIAEVDETWVTPADTRLGEHGALIFRRLRSEVVDDQLERERQEFRKELDDLKAEYAEAKEESKAKLQAKIDQAKEKVETNRQLAISRIEALEKESQEKIHALEEQIKTAHEKRKAKLEKRMEEIKADYKIRVSKLEQSWQLTKEAFSR